MGDSATYCKLSTTRRCVVTADYHGDGEDEDGGGDGGDDVGGGDGGDDNI